MKKYIERGQGQRIKEIRGHSSQKDFAEKLGISTLTLQRYEWGDRIPPISVLKELAQISRRSVDWILTGQEPAVAADRVAEARAPYGMDDVSAKIMDMLRSMSEEERRDVLKHIEKEKLWSEQKLKKEAG